MVELTVALLILTLVITTTLTMMARRRDRIRQANETVLVYQVLANEVEYWRHIDFGALESEAASGFKSDTTLLASLQPFQSAVTVKTDQPDVKEVTLKVDWFNKERHASITVVRTQTGGSNLW